MRLSVGRQVLIDQCFDIGKLGYGDLYDRNMYRTRKVVFVSTVLLVCLGLEYVSSSLQAETCKLDSQYVYVFHRVFSFLIGSVDIIEDTDVSREVRIGRRRRQ